MHALADVQLTPNRFVEVGVGRTVQVLPFVVVDTIPWSPTAMHVFGLQQVTARREIAAPEVWAVQELPPSRLVRIVPPSPTAKQVIESGHVRPRRF